MEEIYEKYSNIIFKYLLTFTHNKEIAEELMQETFYSAIKNIDKFNNNSSLKTWLCKIAKNKFFDYYKKIKKLEIVDIDKVNETLLSERFEDNFEIKEKMIDLYKKIHKLDENSKEVVYLRAIGGFSFKEIGEIMGKKEEWARVIFYRAKIKLKEDFENE